MMSKTEVTQRGEFECAYLIDVDSTYPIMNAHHYRIEVTVTGNKLNNGILLEFSKFKTLINEVTPNDCFIYNNTLSEGAEHELVQTMLKLNILPVGYPFKISAENLVNHFAAILQTKLDTLYPGIIVDNVKLRENNNSYTSWSRNQ